MNRAHLKKPAPWIIASCALAILLLAAFLMVREGPERPSGILPRESTAAAAASPGQDAPPLPDPADSNQEPPPEPVPEATGDAAGDAAMRWLNFTISESGLTLHSSARRPGAVKRQRVLEKEGALYFRVLDSDRQLLWEGTLRDPRRTFYDYLEKNEHTGEETLAGGRVQLPAAEFVLRIPDLDRTAMIEVIDYTSSAGGEPLGAFSLDD